MNGLQHAVVQQLTFSIQVDGKVFLCPNQSKSRKSKSHKVSGSRTLRLEDLMTFDSLTA